MSDKTIEPAIAAGNDIAGIRPPLGKADYGFYIYPKDILQPFTQVSSSTAEAAIPLPATRRFPVGRKSYPPKRNFPGELPRIGVFVCSCGADIADAVDVDLVAAYAKTLAHVIWVENNLFTCSADTRNLIARRIGENNLNRIVIAACAHTCFEAQFREMLREAGLHAYLVEMADIRRQNTLVCRKDSETATEKAMDQVYRSVQKAVRNEPLERRVV